MATKNKKKNVTRRRPKVRDDEPTKPGVEPPATAEAGDWASEIPPVIDPKVVDPETAVMKPPLIPAAPAGMMPDVPCPHPQEMRRRSRHRPEYTCLACGQVVGF